MHVISNMLDYFIIYGYIKQFDDDIKETRLRKEVVFPLGKH